MDILTVNVSVCGITHMFKMDGSIIPLINIFPPIRLQDGTDITKIILPKETKGSDVGIATHDKLQIKIYADSSETVTLKVIEKSESPRRDLTSQVCPICGEPLEPSSYPRAIGRCINRSCMGQITQTMLHFLSTIQVVFKKPLNRILEGLLIRGSLTSLSSIFALTFEDLLSPTCGMIESQMFMHILHSSRGATTVEQLLRGIRVPDWEEANIKRITEIFKENQWSIISLKNFLDPEVQKQYDTIDWAPWNKFNSLEPNKRVVVELCHILEV